MTTWHEKLRDPWAVALIGFVLGIVLCACFFATVIYAMHRTGVMEMPSSADGTGLQFASTAAYISDRHGDLVAAESAVQGFDIKVYGMTIQADAFFPRMSAGAQGMTVSAMHVFDRSPLVRAGDVAQARAARKRILSRAAARLGGHAAAFTTTLRDWSNRDHGRVAHARSGEQP